MSAAGKTAAPQTPPALESGEGGVPNHVAIIMDGNGRWAARRGLPRAEGHRRGVEALRRTVRAAIELGIRYLTIYSFSSENWRRPATEVGELLGLLRLFVRNDLADLHSNNVRSEIIGGRNDLAPDILALLLEAEGADRIEHWPEPRCGVQLRWASGIGPRDAVPGARRWATAASRPRDIDTQLVTAGSTRAASPIQISSSNIG